MGAQFDEETEGAKPAVPAGSDAAELRARSVELVQRLASKAATPSDIAAANAFRATSPAHEAAFSKASRLWLQFGPAAENLRRRGVVGDGLAKSPRAVSRRLIIGGGLAAASVGAVAVVSPPFHMWPTLAELAADHRTETGEQRLLALADDVSVRMNARTSIRSRDTETDTNRFEIVSGQASFATWKDMERPLVLLAGDGSASVRRGRVDIRCFDGQVRITCVEGQVTVRRGDEVATIGSAEQIAYNATDWRKVEAVDIGLVTAWEQGVLIFRTTPLSEVVEEINRFRSGRVVVLNGDLARKTVSGRFRIDNIEDIFLRLDQALGIKSLVLPGGVVLLT